MIIITIIMEDKVKNISKLLIIVFFISLLASACGPVAEPEIFDIDFEKPSSEIDLEGVKIVYEIGLTDTALSKPNCLGYELDTVFGDLALQRLKQTQEDLNCDLIVNYANNGASCSNFFASSASGSFVCDVISGTSDIWADVARIGMLVGLTELEDYLDFRNEAKWGYRNMLEVVYYEDDLYGVVPLLWPEISVDYRTPLVVNENLINALGETDPRDYVENGQWNWDIFDDCLARYYVEEGGEVKQYSLTTSIEDYGGMFIISNGAKYVEKDASGKYVSGFYTDNAKKAMQKAIDIFYGPNARTIDSTSNIVENLISGRTVMGTVRTTSILGSSARVAREMDNFGILSWPVGPDVDPHFACGHYSNIAQCIAFSRLSDHSDAAATIINALYEPFDEYPTQESMIDLMTKNYFFDRRDSELYYEMYYNSIYNYFHYTGMFAMMSSWMSPTLAVSEYLEANEDRINKSIEKYAAPALRAIGAVWGE